MYRTGIRQFKIRDVFLLIEDVFIIPVEVDRHGLVDGIHFTHGTDISVEDFFVIIVTDLHHAVSFPEFLPLRSHGLPVGIQLLLQPCIEFRGSDRVAGPSHRAEDLDVLPVKSHSFRNFFHELDDRIGDIGRLPAFVEPEIRSAPVVHYGHVSVVHDVGIHHDGTALGLPEDPRQPDCGYRS